MTRGGGLEGVVVAESSLCRIDGEEGRLVYRGYDIRDLAENVSFEEVAHLLWHGELPGGEALSRTKAQLGRERALDPPVEAVLRELPRDADAMAALRTAVSVLGAVDPEADASHRDAVVRKALRLTAQMATITAAFGRLRDGLEPVEPRPELDHGANFLYMLTGEEPDPVEARAVDTALVLHAEHGMNASTFSARVTTGTLADTYSAVVSAIGTLKGPLHGGANARVMDMLESIGKPDAALEWIRAALERKERIMGFGHRVYRAKDPRATILEEVGRDVAAERPEASRWFEISRRIEETMAEAMEASGKEVHPNVDFYSASVYRALGIPKDLFTPVFACARITGWTAHILEQIAENRLIRPRAEYVGPAERTVPPISERE